MSGFNGFNGFNGFGGGGYPVADSQTTAAGIRHVAGQAPIDPALVSDDNRLNDKQMGLWSDQVRGWIYVTDFLKNYSWSTTNTDITLRWNGRSMLKLGRPDDALLVDQLSYIHDAMDLRPDRGGEVLGQMGSLAGHYAFILGLTPSRHSKTLELMELTQLLCSHAVMIPKHYLTVRRPDQLDARLMPMIQTPSHGSFPSGHATQAMAVATVLCAVVDEKPAHFPDGKARKALLMKQAERIAANRTVAGVHYPIDSLAGAYLGREVARIIVASAKSPKNRMARLDTQEYIPINEDYVVADFEKRPNPATTEYRVGHSGPIAWLWSEAMGEFL